MFLANELMLDPRGDSFKSMRNYAESKLDNLYEKQNDEIFEKDQSEWNQEFLFNIRNDLDTNFSREMLEYFKRVCKVVLKDKAFALDAEEEKPKSNYNLGYGASDPEPESNNKQKTVKHKNFLRRLINEKVIKPYKKGLEEK